MERQIQHIKQDIAYPERLREAVAEGIISDKEGARIHRRLNDHIRRETARRYRAQEKHLVVEQVCQLEHENAMLAATQLAVVENALGAMSLPDFDRVAVDGDVLLEFAEVVGELPRREYLQMASTSNSQEMLERYEELRDELVELRDQWQYKTDKLEYLRNLRRVISAALVDGDSGTSTRGVSDHMYDSNEEMSDIEVGGESADRAQALEREIERFITLVPNSD